MHSYLRAHAHAVLLSLIYGLILGWLQAGDNVVISSRQKDAVSQVVTELQAAYGQERVHVSV